MHRFVRSLDVFKTMPKEFTQSSVLGGFFTFSVFFFIVFIAFCEFSAYISPIPVNTLEMNNSEAVHSEKSLTIEYNVTLFNLPCDQVDVIVYDPLTQQPLPMSNKGKRTTLSHTGVAGEMQEDHNTDEELRAKYLAAEDKDFDWSKYKSLSKNWVRSDGTVEDNHENFRALVGLNDAIMINYYASWSENCKKFAAIWEGFSETCKTTEFKDHGGKKLTTNCIKVNCVEFPALCMEQNIWNYPTLRIYNRAEKFKEISMKKLPIDTELMSIMRENCKTTRHFEHTSVTAVQGCRLEGVMHTRSVPGEFRFQMSEAVKSLEPAMTNTSHQVHTLRFYSEADKVNPIDVINKVDATVLENINPIAGNTFISKKKHTTLMHYLQVVSTIINVGWKEYHIYQYTSQNSPKIENKLTVPSAKFQYSISPMNVVYKNTGCTLYQFLTTMCGIIGGAIAIAKICFSGSNHVLAKMRRKRLAGKLG